MFYSGRGGYRGGQKPRLPEESKRQPLSCRVKPKTLAKLEALCEKTGESYGRVIDQVIEDTDE